MGCGITKEQALLANQKQSTQLKSSHADLPTDQQIPPSQDSDSIQAADPPSQVITLESFRGMDHHNDHNPPSNRVRWDDELGEEGKITWDAVPSNEDHPYDVGRSDFDNNNNNSNHDSDHVKKMRTLHQHGTRNLLKLAGDFIEKVHKKQDDRKRAAELIQAWYRRYSQKKRLREQQSSIINNHNPPIHNNNYKHNHR